MFISTPSDAFPADPDVLSILADIRFLLALIVAWLTVYAVFALAKCVYGIVSQNITNYF